MKLIFIYGLNLYTYACANGPKDFLLHLIVNGTFPRKSKDESEFDFINIYTHIQNTYYAEETRAIKSFLHSCFIISAQKVRYFSGDNI